jgi:hypothetical protein
VVGSTSRVWLFGGVDVSDKPRTWLVAEEGGSTLTPVVELEPVLDLLERRHNAPDWDEDVSGDVEVFLSEHGRLEET